MDITSAAPTAKESKDQFLKLLVTQLQHQDPLSPMQQEDFLTQLAQFSSLEGIEKLNANIADQMKMQADSFLYQQVSQSASLVGKDISYQLKAANGRIETRTGLVESVALSDNTALFKVGPDSIDVSQILSIRSGSVANAASGTTGSSGSNNRDETAAATDDQFGKTNDAANMQPSGHAPEFIPAKTATTAAEAKLDANGILRRTRGGQIGLTDLVADQAADDSILRRTRDSMAILQSSLSSSSRADGLRRTRDSMTNTNTTLDGAPVDASLDIFRRMRGANSDDTVMPDAAIEEAVLRRVRGGL